MNFQKSILFVVLLTLVFSNNTFAKRKRSKKGPCGFTSKNAKRHINLDATVVFENNKNANSEKDQLFVDLSVQLGRGTGKKCKGNGKIITAEMRKKNKKDYIEVVLSGKAFNDQRPVGAPFLGVKKIVRNGNTLKHNNGSDAKFNYETGFNLSAINKKFLIIDESNPRMKFYQLKENTDLTITLRNYLGEIYIDLNKKKKLVKLINKALKNHTFKVHMLKPGERKTGQLNSPTKSNKTRGNQKQQSHSDSLAATSEVQAGQS